MWKSVNKTCVRWETHFDTDNQRLTLLPIVNYIRPPPLIHARTDAYSFHLRCKYMVCQTNNGYRWHLFDIISKRDLTYRFQLIYTIYLLYKSIENRYLWVGDWGRLRIDVVTVTCHRNFTKLKIIKTNLTGLVRRLLLKEYKNKVLFPNTYANIKIFFTFAKKERRTEKAKERNEEKNKWLLIMRVN